MVMTLLCHRTLPPSPYERACIMAWWFKKNKIPAKIVILDQTRRCANRHGIPEYSSFVPTLLPMSERQNPRGRSVQQEDQTKGDFTFDDAILMSPHQASDRVDGRSHREVT